MASSCPAFRLVRSGEAAKAAKDRAEVLVVSAFADVDGLYDKVARAGDNAEALDAWTAQVLGPGHATTNMLNKRDR